MAGFGYVCALVLAAVFVRAGAAKLARRAETGASFEALGLPGARPLARAVPLAELALAVALIAAPRAGGVASLVLLVVFTGVLIRAIRSGTKVSCSCFGTARAEPVSGVDIVRNVVLAALAVAALLAPGHDLVPAFGTARGAVIGALSGAITTPGAVPNLLR